jgi:UDP-glucose 4-epimerase
VPGTKQNLFIATNNRNKANRGLKLKTILITGGTGFLGQNLILRLVKNFKCYNIGIDKSALCQNIKWDLRRKLDDKKLPKNIDVVIHCASIVGDNEKIPKSDYLDVNVRATLYLLEHSAKNRVKHFIYISTGGVYGFKQRPLKEEDECRPEGMYSLTKYFSELLCKHYDNKMKVTIIRLFFPYGPGQKGRLIPGLTKRISEGKEIELNANGLPVINPIHITDATNIIVKIIERKIGGTFNLAGNKKISIGSIVIKITKNLNKKARIKHTNRKTSSLIGSNDKIVKILKYRFEKSLDNGIEEVCSELENVSRL